MINTPSRGCIGVSAPSNYNVGGSGGGDYVRPGFHRDLGLGLGTIYIYIYIYILGLKDASSRKQLGCRLQSLYPSTLGDPKDGDTV